MSTLHDRIRAVVEERLRLARKADTGERWEASAAACEDELDGCPEQARRWKAEARHIAANDPADAILGAEHALWLLDEIAGWEHEYALGDKYLSCGADEGLPCSCGLTERRMRMLAALGTRWRVEVDG